MNGKTLVRYKGSHQTVPLKLALREYRKVVLAWELLHKASSTLQTALQELQAADAHVSCPAPTPGYLYVITIECC